MMKVHHRIDLADAIKKHPLPAIESLPSDDLTSSQWIAYVEQLRLRFGEIDMGRPIPTDVCLWSKGDSPSREVTKVAGVPYWPVDEMWPDHNGTPMTFVGQLCFADSRDLLPLLPGDVLSFLSAEDDYLTSLEYRWFDLGKQLLPAERIPTPRWEISPCHAQLHRTVEYPNPDFDLLDEVPFPWDLSIWRLDQSKIGGFWMEIGDVPDPDEIEEPDEKRSAELLCDEIRERERTFVGRIASIAFTDPDPPDFYQSLSIGDDGSYSFFWNGEVTSAQWESG